MNFTQQENEIWENSSNDELDEEHKANSSQPGKNKRAKLGSKTSQRSSSSHAGFNCAHDFESEHFEQRQRNFINDDSNNNNDNNNNEYTIDEAFSALGMGKFQYCMMAVSGFVWFSAAVQLMLTSTLLLLLEIQWSVSSLQSTCLASVPFVGEMFGAYLISNMADRYGRKKSVIMSTLLLSLFGTLGGLSKNFNMLIIARMATGFAVGGSTNCLTLFTEFIPKEHRGEMTFLELVFWSLGAVVSVMIGWICYVNDISWRWFLLISSTFAWISIILACFVPESPRFLLTNGDNEQIEEILQWMSRANKKALPKGVLKRHEISNSLHRGNVFDLILPSYLKSTILILIITTCSACTYYGMALFQASYFTSLNSNTTDVFWQNLVCTCTEFPALIVGILIIDRVGRIPFLGASFLLVAICCGLLIVSSSDLGIALLFIGRMCASETYNIIVIYILEYYPTVIRSTALGVAITESKLAAILASYVAENCSNSMASLTFCICCIIAIICVSLLPTETFGIELSDDIILTNGNQSNKKLFDDENDAKYGREEIALLNKIHPLKDAALLGPISSSNPLEINISINNNIPPKANITSQYQNVSRYRTNSL